MTSLTASIFSSSETSGYQLDFTGYANPGANVGLTAAQPGSNIFNLVSAFSTGADGHFNFRVAYPASVKGQTWRFMAVVQYDPANNSAILSYTFPPIGAAPPPPGEPPVTPPFVPSCVMTAIGAPLLLLGFLRTRIRPNCPEWFVRVYYRVNYHILSIFY